MADNVLNPSGIPSNVATKEILYAHHQRVINHNDVNKSTLKFVLNPSIIYNVNSCIGSEFILHEFFRGSKETASKILHVRLNFVNMLAIPCYMLIYSDQISQIQSIADGVTIDGVSDVALSNVQEFLYFNPDDEMRVSSKESSKVLYAKGRYDLIGNSLNTDLRIRLISDSSFQTTFANNSTYILANILWKKD